MLALQFLAFKECPLAPPPTVLLDKQGWLSADHNHWAKIKSSLEKGMMVLLVVHLLYVSVSVYTFELIYSDYNH